MTHAKEDWEDAKGHRWAEHRDALEAWLGPIDAPLVEALDLPPNVALRVADIGCGAGATARAILRGAAPGSVVHGYDVSPPMIEAARAHDPSLASLTFTVGDVAAMAPPEPPYLRLASRFGVMFFDDPSRAFRRLGGWLAPRGRLAFAVWAPPRDNPWIATVRAAVEASTEPLPPPPADAPGPFRYAAADPLVRLLEDEAGVVDVDVSTWRAPLALGGLGTPEDAARFALASFTTFAHHLERFDVAARARAHEELARAFAPHHRDGAVRMPAAIHLVTARARTR
ncbi:MAG: class I SAM-dependent methyltransferase [Myxococcota bacterium]